MLANVHILARMSNNKSALELVDKIFKFAQQTAEEQRPRLCKIALVNINDGTKLSDFVMLWAGAHDGNPIERLEAVIHQRDALKEVLSNIVDKFPEEEKSKYKFLIDKMI